MTPGVATRTDEDDPSADDALGRIVAGKFEIRERIAQGAMGVVYRAQHVTLDVPVALKLLHGHLTADEQFSKRFQREARIACSFVHTNSVRVFDCGAEPDGTLYLAMEYIDGRDLWSILETDGRLEPARIVHLLLQVLSALGAAHGVGVVHRDMKPENVMVLAGLDENGDPSEIAKVCDFGIASIATGPAPGSAAAAQASRLTLQGIVIGTPTYMSPEQARGEVIDARSDLYSVGIMLYQLLTGVAPFDAETPLAIVLKHIGEAPLPPSHYLPDVHPGLAEVAMQAIAKAPADRFQSARSMRAALREAMGWSEADPMSMLPGSRSRMDSSAGMPDGVYTMLSPEETAHDRLWSVKPDPLPRHDTSLSASARPGPPTSRTPSALPGPVSEMPGSLADSYGSVTRTPHLVPLTASLPTPAEQSRRRSVLLAAVGGGLLALAAIGGVVVREAGRTTASIAVAATGSARAGGALPASEDVTSTTPFVRAAPPPTGGVEPIEFGLTPPSAVLPVGKPAPAMSATAETVHPVVASAAPNPSVAPPPVVSPTPEAVAPAAPVSPPLSPPASSSPPAATAAAPSAPAAPAAPAGPARSGASARVAFVDVANERGVTRRSVQAGVGSALPRLSECYRASFASNPASGGKSGALHVDTDGDGVVVAAVVRGALAPAAARCMERVMLGIQFSGVDTGEATADVSLSLLDE